MELAPVPRRRPPSSWMLLALVLLALAPVTVLAVVPTAFGLQRYVIGSDDSALGRGTATLQRTVPIGDVEPGDVVTYPVGRATGGDPDATGFVTREVVAVEGSTLTTTVGRDPLSTEELSDETTVSRVLVAVPWVGYPFLSGLASPLPALAALLLGLLLALALLRGTWRVPRLHRVAAGSSS